MVLVGQGILTDFAADHADVRSYIESWVAEIKSAKWQTPIDLTARYPRADHVGEDRYVFDIKGRDYRLLARVNFKNQIVRVLRIGTHAEYSKWKL
ncbi:MAG: type II toxin-antitoxin system HigB family toxin [Anaerolineales bacterium]